MTTQIISRAEAQARGLSRYFTGKPCKHGHLSEKKTVNGTCITCQEIFLEKYRSENKDHIRETDRIHRQANVEKHRAKDRLARQRNPEKFRERDRVKYYKTDREVLRKHRRDRKARQKNAPGSHTLAEIIELLHKQKFECATCRASLRDEKELDHIVALSRGGSNFIENLQWLCPPCNRRKHAKDPIQWANENGRLL